MTPTQDQCLKAMHYLSYAADDARVGYYMASVCDSDHHRRELIRHLELAVAILGYALQPIPFQEADEPPPPQEDAP